MPRYSDIKGAFIKSITLDSKRGQIVTTVRFVEELGKVNHHWTLQQANEWIDHYQSYFRDYSDHERGDKRYFLQNMGYVR